MKKMILYPTDDIEIGDELFETGITSINTLILHDETLGVTQRALKALRDELAQRIEHELLMFQVPSGDSAHCEVYGLFLVDKTAREIAIIGDGFRGDGSGEGGAGAITAQALLTIYNLLVIEMLPEEAITYRSDPDGYKEIVTSILQIAEAECWVTPIERTPHYIRHLVRRWA